MRTRTPDQFDAEYHGLTTGEFARATGQSPAQVRRMIAAGWFGWREDGRPECINIGDRNAGRPTYRIHREAVARFLRERSVAA